MRAFVVSGPGQGAVEVVEPPTAGSGHVVVEVERVGVCGTDVEFFTGEMAYLHQGHAAYPLRLGHEWCGTVASIGRGVDAAWMGRRVTADTMLGCGRCRRCLGGRQHLCDLRHEIGIRGGWPGALAEQVMVPAAALYALPDAVDLARGALVEPGANALRAVSAAALEPGRSVCVWGAGTIGLLAALFARAAGADVHIVGRSRRSLELAGALGISAWAIAAVPVGPFDAVIDATDDAAVPAAALDLVESGGRVVYIGLAGDPSRIDTRSLVLKEVTAVGVLSGSGELARAVEMYATGRVDPTPLVAGVCGLDRVADVLGGWRPADAGPGPKVHIDPRL